MSGEARPGKAQGGAGDGRPRSGRFDLTPVIDRLHEGIQVLGRDLTYLYVNQVAAAHGEKRVDELVGRRMSDVYPGIEETEMFARLQQVLDRGGLHRMENEFAYPDGSKRWFELHIEGIPQGAVVFSLDITERKVMDLNLRRAQRMEAVGQLAGGVAHDFNNLLTVIQSYVALALEELGKDHPLTDDLAMVLAASGSAGELTHKLLGFARQLPVEPSSVVVHEALQRVVPLVRGAAGETIALSVELPDVGAVRIDPGALDQVLLNLALNARDAMSGGGRLSISVSRARLTEEWSLRRGVTLPPGGYAVIAVSDSGVGIPAELQDRIFDPFFTTKGADGTGLGLATCWGLVQQAGGTMTVYSEEGEGTTIKVFLPLHEPDAAAPSHVEVATPGERGAQATGTILLVEDEAALRLLIGRVLRKAGYKLVEATSGAEALLILEDVGDRVDLLLSDVVMPRMSGTELARRVRALHPRIRMLLMSGLAGPGLDPRDSGEAASLSKPFTPSALLAAVGRAIGGSGHLDRPDGEATRSPSVS